MDGGQSGIQQYFLAAQQQDREEKLRRKEEGGQTSSKVAVDDLQRYKLKTANCQLTSSN